MFLQHLYLHVCTSTYECIYVHIFMYYMFLLPLCIAYFKAYLGGGIPPEANAINKGQKTLETHRHKYICLFNLIFNAHKICIKY